LIHVDTSYASGRLQNVRFAGPGPPIMDNEWDKAYMEQLVLEL
jgi:hypothetical protein